MAISIDWGNKIINIPKSYLTLLSGTLYELDSDQLRKDLLDIQDSEEGIAHDDTHRHNPPVTIAGVTYAQTIEIINGYKLEFEDGQYTVKIVGSNNNFADVDAGIVVRNQVSLVSTNAAGLITVVQGSGVTEQDKLDIADRVWDELLSEHTVDESASDILRDSLRTNNIANIVDAIWDELVNQHLDSTTFGGYIQEIKNKTDTINWAQIEFLWDILGGKREIINNQEIFYKSDNVTEIARFNLFDKNGQPSETNVYKRERV